MYQLDFYADVNYSIKVGEFILTTDMLTQCSVNPLYATISYFECESLYNDNYYGSKQDIIKFRDAIEGCNDLNLVINKILSLQLETYYIRINYKEETENGK